MGIYINPRDRSKEDWLKEHYIEAYATTPPPFERGDTMLVCLVDNGVFTAAAVAFDEGEYAAFARNDGRPKIWFTVAKTDLEAVTGSTF